MTYLKAGTSVMIQITAGYNVSCSLWLVGIILGHLIEKSEGQVLSK